MTLLVVWSAVGAVAGVLLVSAIAVLSARALLARRAAPHDETLRAGSARDVDPAAAAQRANGLNSWMRPGGGGL